MSAKELAAYWAEELGLADAPLFCRNEVEAPDLHRILLDGGIGSFALSVADHHGGEITPDELTASWIWSSNLSHHVFVTNDQVYVSRWDDLDVSRRLSRANVEEKLETFYRYLQLDGVSHALSIADHAVELFRRIRSWVYEKNLPDEAAVDHFLFFLACELEGITESLDEDVSRLLENHSIANEFTQAIRDFRQSAQPSLREHFVHPRSSVRDLKLWPQLMVRHAGGIVFQEAHYDIRSWSPTDLLGLPGISQVHGITRGATHFTPPGLARCVVERAIDELQSTDHISILDPACGSGIFLHEALRTLARRGFTGRVQLHGRDVSPYAVAMARFTVNEAVRDWPENLGPVEVVEIETANSLSDDVLWPAADLVLMNPPFISWPLQTREQQSESRRILGDLRKGRPDYSMSFIKRAIDAICDNGVVGSLMPASLLGLSAASDWREYLLSFAAPKFIAVLGHHGLFPHAVVEVAATVFVKGASAAPSEDVLLAWSNEKPSATSDALRAVRQTRRRSSFPHLSDDDWSVTRESLGRITSGPDWRPKPNRIQKALLIVEETCKTVLSDLLAVRQGARTGLNEAFLIEGAAFRCLPEIERKFFRAVAENRNIRDGRITEGRYVFFPTSVDLPDIQNEEDIATHIPTFLRDHLAQFRSPLIDRARKGPHNWWRLSEDRSWQRKRDSKLVSTYFGTRGSFAWDGTGEYVVVQGHGLLVRDNLGKSIRSVPVAVRTEFYKEVMLSYAALFFSDIFASLLSEFCPHVAGGQFNLSKKYLDKIPLPDMAQIGAEQTQKGQAMQYLAGAGARLNEGIPVSRRQINDAVAKVYGTRTELWLTST